MTKEEVELSLKEKEDFLGVCYDKMAALSQEKNAYKSQVLMQEIWIDMYKTGYVAGYHQGNGNTILNNIKTTNNE